MSTLTIDALFESLAAEFRHDTRGRGVARLLEEYALGIDDWREFSYFEPDGYTRNLVYRNDDFELLLLCWGAGQESPIHNHAGQNCWMTVLDGQIEEVHFRQSSPGAPGPLVQGDARTFEPGQVAFITDDIALHLVRPTNGRQGVSLHLYARPIEACNVYCERTGEVVRKKLGYDTVRGDRSART